MRKVIWTCVLAIMIVGSVFAAGSRESATTGVAPKMDVSFGWWGAEGRHAYTQGLANLFAETNPGVSFTFQPNSWTGYWEKIATQAAAGSLPTVMQFFFSFIPTYAENNLLLDLGPYVEKGVLNVSTIDKNLLDTGYYKGKLVTIPLSMSSRAVVYNPDALAKAGMGAPSNDWTWDDFAAMCKLYTQRTGNYAIDGYTNNWMMLQLMLLQRGHDMFNKTGTALGFDSPVALVEFFSFWDDMLKSGCVYGPDINASMVRLPSDQSNIALGTSAFVYNSNSYPGWTGNQSLRLAPVPYRVKGVDVNWVVPGLSFSVSSSAKDATAQKMVEFVDWWLNSEAVADVQGTDRGFPASKVIQDYLNAKPGLTPLQKDTFDYFAYLQNHSGPMPAQDPVGANEVTDLCLHVLEDMLSGKLTPQGAAEAFFSGANRILARNKK